MLFSVETFQRDHFPHFLITFLFWVNYIKVTNYFVRLCSYYNTGFFSICFSAKTQLTTFNPPLHLDINRTEILIPYCKTGRKRCICWTMDKKFSTSWLFHHVVQTSFTIFVIFGAKRRDAMDYHLPTFVNHLKAFSTQEYYNFLWSQRFASMKPVQSNQSVLHRAAQKAQSFPWSCNHARDGRGFACQSTSKKDVKTSLKADQLSPLIHSHASACTGIPLQNICWSATRISWPWISSMSPAIRNCNCQSAYRDWII